MLSRKDPLHTPSSLKAVRWLQSGVWDGTHALKHPRTVREHSDGTYSTERWNTSHRESYSDLDPTISRERMRRICHKIPSNAVKVPGIRWVELLSPWACEAQRWYRTAWKVMMPHVIEVCLIDIHIETAYSTYNTSTPEQQTQHLQPAPLARHHDASVLVLPSFLSERHDGFESPTPSLALASCTNTVHIDNIEPPRFLRHWLSAAPSFAGHDRSLCRHVLPVLMRDLLVYIWPIHAHLARPGRQHALLNGLCRTSKMVPLWRDFGSLTRSVLRQHEDRALNECGDGRRRHERDVVHAGGGHGLAPVYEAAMTASTRDDGEVNVIEGGDLSTACPVGNDTEGGDEKGKAGYRTWQNEKRGGHEERKAT
ncbi:hypothetical protein C8Q74DRAFT_1218964 [Fomes fomentarius]|nr:hypothetical protein C8Q74DRAFT_1218964 [Fomes fomentarius]